MKPLPLKLRKNGFNYTQVLRGGRSCLYSQEVSKNSYCFEVFEIIISRDNSIGGKIIESREKFPHNEAFGKWAWSFMNYSDAVKKFKELENG
jgi:hypothetical protein